MPTRWLITGGSGFIGTNLIEALLSGGGIVSSVDIAPPLATSQKQVWENISILDREKLISHVTAYRPDIIIHLAANTGLSLGKDSHAFDVNTIGVANVIDAACAAGSTCRLIAASSMLVCRLGYQPEHDQDYCPSTPYGRSKVETENIVRAAQGRLPWVLVRPTTIWGPWHIRLKDEFLSRLRSGRYVHPSKDCRRSYGYVGNVVHQLIQIAEAPEKSVVSKMFYVGDESISLSSYVDGFSLQLIGRPAKRVPYVVLKTAAIMGDMLSKIGFKKIPLTSYRLSNMTSDNVLDMKSTIEIAGNPLFTLDQGIARTCEWLHKSV